MKLKVNKNEIKIIEKSILNDGEYKVNKCEFEFTEEYDGLIKKAVFSSDYKYYKMVVENDECDIPIEVLKKGKIKIGVYAYKIENGEYVRRYSPVPIIVEVIDGSYVEKIENISTPSEVEQLEEQLQKKQDLLISGTNIKTLNGESLLGEGDIYISASGNMRKEVYDTNDNGIVDNAEKVNNHTVEKDVPANAVFTDTVFSGDYNDLSNKPSIPSKTSDLTNDAGYLTSHQDISGKQDTLVSGSNIKTINNETILGNGNIEIQGGEAETIYLGDVTDFTNPNYLELNGLKKGYYLISCDTNSPMLRLKVKNGENEFFAYLSLPGIDGNNRIKENVIYLYVENEIPDEFDTAINFGKCSYELYNANTNYIAFRKAIININSNSISIQNTIDYFNLFVIDKAQTISGKKTFTTLPESSVVPTTDNQLVNKAYVDTQITGALGGDY